jgi:hypothetical protein
MGKGMYATSSTTTATAALLRSVGAQPKHADHHPPYRPFRISDAYWPLDNHAKLYARTAVRTFHERREFIFREIVNEWILILKEPGNYAHARVPASVVKNNKYFFDRLWGNDKILDVERHQIAVECARYRSIWEPMQCLDAKKPTLKERSYALRRGSCRRVYMVCSAWGTIPKAWDMLTSSASAVVAVSVTGLMSQFQTEVVKYENAQESLTDLEQWILFFLQVMLFSVVVLFLVYVINWGVVAFRKPSSMLARARFTTISQEYGSLDAAMDCNDLEYDSDQDPDVAMMYFSMREAAWCREGRRGNACARFKLYTHAAVDSVWNVLMPYTAPTKT